MLLIAGTVPIKNLPLTIGKVNKKEDILTINEHNIPCNQGSGAMIGSALITTEYFGLDRPVAIIAGDVGDGKGSRKIYNYLTEHIANLYPEVVALHYCMPYMGLTKKLCKAIEECQKKPIIIADAGSMYSAKASGMAKYFDIFTPDASEIAFLADPNATHPAYISRHLFDTDVYQTPRLAKIAYQGGGAAKLLLVKGSIDYIVFEGEILDTITEPNIPALEAIGGTGDTITGLVSGLTYAGFGLQEAATIAARTNRLAGKYAKANLATRVSQIINQIPTALYKINP